jgi:hypothetical protein
LRSIAYWDWAKLDQAAGLTHGMPVIVEAPAQQELFEDVEELDAEVSPSPAFQLLKRAGGWYLNEVPEELLAACEKELSTADPLLDLTETTCAGDDEGTAEAAVAAETAGAQRVAAQVTSIVRSGGLVTPSGWFQLVDPT